MEIRFYPEEYSVCKMHGIEDLPKDAPFAFFAQTDAELSLVCESRYAPKKTTAREDGWKMMRIEGTLDFSLVGILARIADILAREKISIFAASTYDTDYIFVKAEKAPEAAKRLAENGYAVVAEIRPEILGYVEETIIPLYDGFDKAHDRAHALHVIQSSLDIAREYDVNREMVYVIAAYHDTGLAKGRDGHEKNSGVFLLADEKLKTWFSPEQLAVMGEAVEDHRASNTHAPRSLYGSIVSEADRDINYANILRRTLLYSLEHFPEYGFEEHYARTKKHIENKYGENGYLQLWLHTEKNAQGLAQLREALRDEARLRAEFEALWQELTA